MQEFKLIHHHQFILQPGTFQHIIQELKFSHIWYFHRHLASNKPNLEKVMTELFNINFKSIFLSHFVHLRKKSNLKNMFLRFSFNS